MPAFKNTSKTHNDKNLGKEIENIIVVDTSLHSLTGIFEFKIFIPLFGQINRIG